MSNLIQFKNEDGIEIIINRQTGESFATISGYARMSGLNLDTIAKRVKRGSKGLDIQSVKSAKIQTQGGLQGVRLINENTVSEWLPKDNPNMASKMLKLGIRTFLHKLAGYEIHSTAIAQPPIAEAEPEPKPKLELASDLDFYDTLPVEAIVALPGTQNHFCQRMWLYLAHEEVTWPKDHLLKYGNLLRDWWRGERRIPKGYENVPALPPDLKPKIKKQEWFSPNLKYFVELQHHKWSDGYLLSLLKTSRPRTPSSLNIFGMNREDFMKLWDWYNENKEISTKYSDEWRIYEDLYQFFR